MQKWKSYCVTCFNHKAWLLLDIFHFKWHNLHFHLSQYVIQIAQLNITFNMQTCMLMRYLLHIHIIFQRSRTKFILSMFEFFDTCVWCAFYYTHITCIISFRANLFLLNLDNFCRSSFITWFGDGMRVCVRGLLCLYNVIL